MENLFSSLIYRLIGEPGTWQQSSVDRVHTLLDKYGSLDSKENIQELEFGSKIIDRVSTNDTALSAVETFLEGCRFSFVILDADFKIVFHNQLPTKAIKDLCHPGQKNRVKSTIIAKIIDAEKSHTQKSSQSLIKLDFKVSGIEGIYLKLAKIEEVQDISANGFYILVTPSESQQKMEVSADLKTNYKISAKEEKVLISILEGKSVKLTAEELCVSENTVKTHLKSLFKKTQTSSQQSLILLFLNHEVQLLQSYFDFKGPATSLSNSHNQDLFINLSKRQKICYREYGPKDGKPIIVMHSFHAGRFQIPANYQSACEQHHRRIIIPERPGYGKSTWQEGYPDQWNKQFSEFVDHLGVQSFDLMGNGLSTNLVLRYCATNDVRVNKAILASPMIIASEGHKKYLGGVLLASSRLHQHSPIILAEIYKLWLKSMSNNSKDKMVEHIAERLAYNEQQLAQSDSFPLTITKNLQAAIAQSCIGSVTDFIDALKANNLNLEQINTAVDIWAGKDNNYISIDGVLATTATLRNKKVHIKEGYGQYLYYSLFADIIAQD